MTPLPSAPRSSLLTGIPAAAVVLAAFWLLMLASLREKCATADEIGHAASGYSYWLYGDYRMNPENGNLPQRFMALPFLLSHDRFPPTADEAWLQSDEWSLGYEWFYTMGNDAGAMLLRGRAVCGLLAVALGALVWLWAGRLFGPAGAMLSLLLYVLNPTILANGALMTSDTACSLFFLASAGSIWAVLHRLTVPRVLLSALIVGGLFVSKMSAVLILPIALALVIARLIDGRPLPVEIGAGRKLTRRSRQAGAFALAAAVHAVVAVAVVWGFYGFRYPMFARAVPGRDHALHAWAYLLDKPSPIELLDKAGLSGAQRERTREIFKAHRAEPLGWRNEAADAVLEIERGVLTPAQRMNFDAMAAAPPPGAGGRVIDFINRHRLLPEAYVYGYANTWKYSQHRAEFFNGRFGHFGWKSFFPYTFLVKTPLSVFGVMALALAAAAAGWRGAGPRPFHDAIPLLVLLAFYWALVIPSHLNIGHRHIMPTYAPLFVLCGAASFWLSAGRPAGRLCGAALAALLLALAGEVLYRFPNYIPYFNGIVSPARAYRHLVDSSLDWGQDLPGLKRYIGDRRPAGPLYLSYFGNASPDYYRIPAAYLHSNPGRDEAAPLQVFDRLDDARALRALHPDYDLIRSGLPSADGSGDTPVYLLLRKPAALRLAGGTYFISATMLQPVERVDSASPFGPWNARYEGAYQILRRTVAPLLEDDPQIRMAALQTRPITEWADELGRYQTLRFARLTAYLRRREPDDTVDFSILVYRLTDLDIARALEGPPAELGPDVAAAMDADR